MKWQLASLIESPASSKASVIEVAALKSYILLYGFHVASKALPFTHEACLILRASPTSSDVGK